MIRVSAGTASVMGLNKIKAKVNPTTGYLMLGTSCLNSCAYCSQGKKFPGAKERLSRVNWPEFDLKTVLKSIEKGEENGLKRICIQELRTSNNLLDNDYLVDIIGLIKTNTELPLSISSNAKSLDDIKEFLKAGADKLGISLDVSSPVKFNEYKNGSFYDRLEFIKSAGRTYPGKITSHIIVGLGETDKELLSSVSELISSGVRVALFAFTPSKGTPLFYKNPPSLRRYRVIQAVHYLFNRECISWEDLIFDDDSDFPYWGANGEGNLTGCKASGEWIEEFLRQGKAFETSGCSHCNRPYYNENPREVPYNYPRPLKEIEIEKAVGTVLNDLSLIPNR